MDKVFNVEIDGQITLPDGRKLGPFEETTVNVVQPSEGSSDPILSNAKQTGGIGYTEHGEQTVITWDGDTSGKEVVSSVPPFQLVKVAEAENHEKFKSANVSINIEGSIIDGIVSNVEETEIESVYRAIVPIEGEGTAVVFIAENSWEFDGENHSAGIYFIYDNGQIFVTSLTYGTPDTVHKIDEKYLPASGGDFIIHVTEDDDGNLVADKTYKEVFEARNNGVAVKAIYRWAVYPINSYYNSGGFSGQFIPIDVAGNLMYVFTLKFGFDDNDNPQITHNQTSYTLTAST